jgi:glycosyltransferase involved in cell wall biosynthesis
MEYKVSIIVPIYNTEVYLDKCIMSILNQTLDKIQIILVNDGSTDNSENIATKYLYNKNIEYISKKNEGQGKARNIALEMCHGEYIGFIDSDDFIDPNMLEEMYCKAKSTNSEIVICNYEVITKNMSNVNLMKIDENKIYSQEDIVNMFLTTSNVQGFSCNKIFSRKIFHEKKIRFEINMKYEDIPAVFRAIYASDRFAFINKPFYKYVQHKESTTNSLTFHMVKDLFSAIKLVKSELIYNNQYPIYERQFKKYVITNILYYYYVTKKIADEQFGDAYQIMELLYCILGEFKLSDFLNSFLNTKEKVKFLLMKLELMLKNSFR